MPYSLDGIAVDEYAFDEFPGGNGLAIRFNGDLSDKEQLALRSTKEDSFARSTSPPGQIDHLYQLSEEQRTTKEQRRATIPEWIGRIGANSAIVSGAYEIGATAGAFAGTAIGSVLIVGTTIVDHTLLSPRRHQRRAIEALESVRNRFVDPEQGSISFQNHAISDTFTITVDKRTRDSLHPLLEVVGHQAVDFRSTSDSDTYQIAISPGKLVLGLLRQEAEPYKLWHSGFGRQVKEFSDIERRVLEQKELLKAEKDRGDYTGYPNKYKISAHAQELKDSEGVLLAKALAITQECATRADAHRQEQRRAQNQIMLETLAKGENEKTHPFEMELMPFYSIVCDSLGGLDPNEESTYQFLTDLNKYFIGMRDKLTHPSQIMSFYKGLHAKFSSRLPELPVWEDARDAFGPAARAAEVHTAIGEAARRGRG